MRCGTERLPDFGCGAGGTCVLEGSGQIVDHDEPSTTIPQGFRRHLDKWAVACPRGAGAEENAEGRRSKGLKMRSTRNGIRNTHCGKPVLQGRFSSSFFPVTQPASVQNVPSLPTACHPRSRWDTTRPSATAGSNLAHSISALLRNPATAALRIVELWVLLSGHPKKHPVSSGMPGLNTGTAGLNRRAHRTQRPRVWKRERDSKLTCDSRQLPKRWRNLAPTPSFSNSKTETERSSEDFGFFCQKLGCHDGRWVQGPWPGASELLGGLESGSQSGATQFSKRYAKTLNRLPNRILNTFGRGSGLASKPGCFGQGDAMGGISPMRSRPLHMLPSAEDDSTSCENDLRNPRACVC